MRFGFEPAAALGLTCDWEVPAEAFMVNMLNAELGAGCGACAVSRGVLDH